MKKKIPLTGNAAFAEAMRQINPDVVAAYPITPQTEIMMTFAEFVADGLVDTELVTAESEHSAMSACVGASAAGARVMTATSAQGLALMHEVVYIASGLRLPIVMGVVNRALSAPINIHCDHADTMAERDSGWIQIYSETAQEVYDHTILAIRLAEREDVRLPVMVCQDGFITSHGVEPVEILDDEVVKKFIGEFKPWNPLLDTDNPKTYGALDLFDYYFEHKRQQFEAMKHVPKAYEEVAEELSKITGRKYPKVEGFYMDDAEYVIVVMSSTAGTTKHVVKELRAQGKKVGLLKIRLYRPFPKEEISRLLEGKKAVAVLDRAYSVGAEAPLFCEIKSALYDVKAKPVLASYIYGLGGRDTPPSLIRSVYEDLMNGNISKEEKYLGVRE
ncbi:MAG: pyruvate synthase subunit PorA [Synergistetes bacterium]|nr:pyruvate synthase subunit PorA [Synergistota bacterium]MCX8127713.1 pyruvate synthase subunit PorA [Synergistota bacterium]MDW8191372.1 pyruvate synthase subunit PorA [Synergistota bacterium]